MKHKVIQNSTIASYLLKLIFGLYFVVTLIVTIAQLTAEYYHTKDNVTKEIQSLADTFVPGVGTLLWTFSNNQLYTLMQGISKVQVIVGIKIQNDNEQNFLAIGSIVDDQGNYIKYNFEGNRKYLDASQYLFWHEFPIFYTDENGKKHHVGKGTFYSSHEIVFMRVK
jgi:hypothetical protein